MNTDKTRVYCQRIQFKLTRTESEVLKGIALIFLLIHHLFYIQDGKYDDIQIFGHGIVESLAKSAKVCVPLFVFLSGYGLMASAERSGTVCKQDFYKRRFVKLYSNYWLMWFIFVPMGIFVFGITLADVYGNHYLVKFTLEIIGLLNCLGLYGYNPTWWFYSCIILLYLLFPFIVSLFNSSLILE